MDQIIIKKTIQITNNLSLSCDVVLFKENKIVKAKVLTPNGGFKKHPIVGNYIGRLDKNNVYQFELDTMPGESAWMDAAMNH